MKGNSEIDLAVNVMFDPGRSTVLCVVDFTQVTYINIGVSCQLYQLQIRDLFTVGFNSHRAVIFIFENQVRDNGKHFVGMKYKFLL